MSNPFTVCEISPKLSQLLKEFRFRKSGHKLDAIVMKVDKEQREIVLEHELEDTTMDDLLEHLPDHQPRFVLLTMELKVEAEARVSYPLVFIFISPRDCNPELQMMYAGSKLMVQGVVDCGGKVFEVRELEELDLHFLKSKLLGVV